MKKGGYKIIDFKGTSLSSTAVEIPGIFDKIVDNYDKVIMVSGVILNGELQDDAYATVSDTETTVLLSAYGGNIIVTEDNEVTFAAVSAPEELAEEIGNLESLQTTDKDSVVDAINEVVGESIKTTGVKSISIGSVTENVDATIGAVASLIPSGTTLAGVMLVNAGGASYTDWGASIFVINNNLVVHPTKTQDSFSVSVILLYI